MKLTGEPSLNQIDDYNNNETPEKRRTIRLIIVGLFLLSGIYGYLKFSNNTVSDYVGTQEKPGIIVAPH